MNRGKIEREARRVQFEVWSQRRVRWPMGEPPVEAMFEPRVVAEMIGLEYEMRDSIRAIAGKGNDFEAAGTLDRRRGVLVVSTRFSYPVQRFTAAHEIGHFVLHPWIGDAVIHRDRPISGAEVSGRPELEQEADYFAACLLAPVKLLTKEFEARFGTRRPLPLTETVAYHLRGESSHELFAADRRSLAFPQAVAAAQSFAGRRFPSLAQHFGMSVTALAIRLRETDLVSD